MKCPKCDKAMSKVRREITSNLKMGKDFKEYDKITYQCKIDDIWVNIETPMVGRSEKLTEKKQ